MKVLITAYDNGCVTFVSEWGTGRARWAGDIAGVRGEHDVEIDIDRRFRWGEDIIPVRSSETSIALDGIDVVFAAEILSCDVDVVVARIGDGIVLLEAEEPIDGADGFVRIRVRQDDIALYPVSF